MGYVIRGFLYGVIIVIVFSLIIAPMTKGSIIQSDGTKCDYSCSIDLLLKDYQNPLVIFLYGTCWFLGTRIAKLAYLVSIKERKCIDPKRNEFKWVWEHKLHTIED